MSDDFEQTWKHLFQSRMPYVNLTIVDALTIKNPFAHLINTRVKKIENRNFQFKRQFYAVHASKAPHNIGLVKQYLDYDEIVKSKKIQGKIFGIINVIYINNIKNKQYKKILEKNMYYGMVCSLFILLCTCTTYVVLIYVK